LSAGNNDLGNAISAGEGPVVEFTLALVRQYHSVSVDRTIPV
jgi:hypothetical protein